MKIKQFGKRAWLAAVLVLAAIPAGAAQVANSGHWMVRLRGVVVAPNDSSGAVSTLPGSGVGVSTDAIPKLDISYLAISGFPNR